MWACFAFWHLRSAWSTATIYFPFADAVVIIQSFEQTLKGSAWSLRPNLMCTYSHKSCSRPGRSRHCSPKWHSGRIYGKHTRRLLKLIKAGKASCDVPFVKALTMAVCGHCTARVLFPSACFFILCILKNTFALWLPVCLFKEGGRESDWLLGTTATSQSSTRTCTQLSRLQIVKFQRLSDMLQVCGPAAITCVMAEVCWHVQNCEGQGTNITAGLALLSSLLDLCL